MTKTGLLAKALQRVEELRAELSNAEADVGILLPQVSAEFGVTGQQVLPLQRKRGRKPRGKKSQKARVFDAVIGIGKPVRVADLEAHFAAAGEPVIPPKNIRSYLGKLDREEKLIQALGDGLYATLDHEEGAE